MSTTNSMADEFEKIAGIGVGIPVYEWGEGKRHSLDVGLPYLAGYSYRLGEGAELGKKHRIYPTVGVDLVGLHIGGQIRPAGKKIKAQTEDPHKKEKEHESQAAVKTASILHFFTGKPAATATQQAGKLLQTIKDAVPQKSALEKAQDQLKLMKARKSQGLPIMKTAAFSAYLDKFKKVRQLGKIR